MWVPLVSLGRPEALACGKEAIEGSRSACRTAKGAPSGHAAFHGHHGHALATRRRRRDLAETWGPLRCRRHFPDRRGQPGCARTSGERHRGQGGGGCALRRADGALGLGPGPPFVAVVGSRRRLDAAPNNTTITRQLQTIFARATDSEGKSVEPRAPQEREPHGKAMDGKQATSKRASSVLSSVTPFLGVHGGSTDLPSESVARGENCCNWR